MDDSREYFRNTANANEFENHKRDEFKKRNEFNDTGYFKIADFSLRLFEQALQAGKDVYQNDLTSEEMQLLEKLVNVAKKELNINRIDYERDQE